MLEDELAHLVDGVDAVQVALALCHAPGEQAVTSQNQPLSARIIRYRAFDEERQFEAGALPGNPYDLAAELRLLNCSSLRFPFALAASAIAQSG